MPGSTTKRRPSSSATTPRGVDVIVLNCAIARKSPSAGSMRESRRVPMSVKASRPLRSTAMPRGDVSGIAPGVGGGRTISWSVAFPGVK